MTDGNEPVFPSPEGPFNPETGRTGWAPSFGITIREEFAKAAMVGILSNRSLIDSLEGRAPQWIGEQAVRVAEATIAALNGEVSTPAVPDGEFLF